jgi:SnoaL-like domain
MTNEDPRAAFDRYIAALASRDINVLRECMDPDFASINPLRPSRSFQGRDTFLDAWTRNWDALPDLRTEVGRTAVTDGHIWFESRRVRGDGSVMACGVNIVRIENGRFRESTTYIDAPVDDGESIATWAQRQRRPDQPGR